MRNKLARLMANGLEDRWGDKLGWGIIPDDIMNWHPTRNIMDVIDYGGVKYPQVDICEKEDTLVVTAEVPGMDCKDIDIDINDGILTIRGNKKNVSEVKEGWFRRVERRYGTFERYFSLPVSVDEDGVNASYRGGVLTITMPKVVKEESKKIQIVNEDD